MPMPFPFAITLPEEDPAVLPDPDLDAEEEEEALLPEFALPDRLLVAFDAPLLALELLEAPARGSV